MTQLESQLLILVSPIANELGYLIVSLTYKNKELDVLLEKLATDTQGNNVYLPVTVEDCAKFSRAIATLIEEKDLIGTEYNIIVGSPGIDRPLLKYDDYKRFEGNNIKITTKKLINNQKKWQGKLLLANEQGIEFLCNKDQLFIDYNDIDKASLDVLKDFDINGVNDVKE